MGVDGTGTFGYNGSMELVPVTSAANCFVRELGVLGPVFRKGLNGAFEDTGVRMSVHTDTQLHGVPFRFENCSSVDCQKALARVKELMPGVIAKLRPGAVVFDWRVPAVGTVGTDTFVVLGDDLVALAPQWVLLANAVSEPGKIGPTALDIERTVTGIRPGRFHEVFD